MYNHADPDYGGGGGGGGVPSYDTSGDDDGHDDLSNITFGDNIDDSVKEQIKEFIQSLPEELQNQEVKIVIDYDLMKYLSKATEDSYVNNAAFLYDGRIVNGVSIDGDTIILKDANNISDIFEELLHVWQYHNCWKNGANSDNTVNAMEFQAEFIEVIYDYINTPDGLQSSDSLFKYDIMMFYEDNLSSFNLDTFMNFLNSISQERWEEYYKEWSDINKGKYTKTPDIDDTYYDWNWGINIKRDRNAKYYEEYQ